MNPPPPHFVIRREEAGPRVQTWSVWRGRERVGELVDDGDTGQAKVTIWGRTKHLGSWGGETAADKFQRWLVSSGAAQWVEACRLAHLRD